MIALRAALNTVLALPLMLLAAEIMAIAKIMPTHSAWAQTRPMQGSNLPNPFNQSVSGDRPQTSQDYTLIFVNPNAGVDQASGGSERHPLRTITYALNIAEPNTIIVLAPGVYSRDSGEQFPLALKPGITVQGSPSSNIPQAMIQGGGDFVSPTLSLQNVAVIAADRSGLAHVVVSNPNPHGQGIWIEAGSPILIENVFSGSGHAGVFIAGRGQPTIARNHFQQNAVAGLVIYGASTATVQDNLFEQTGVGITVSEAATPQILRNQIIGNREGIVLLSGADPVLQANDIRQNRRNGVVDFGDTPAITAVLYPTPSANAITADESQTQPPTVLTSPAIAPPINTATAATTSPITSNQTPQGYESEPPSQAELPSHSSPEPLPTISSATAATSTDLNHASATAIAAPTETATVPVAPAEATPIMPLETANSEPETAIPALSEIPEDSPSAEADAAVAENLSEPDQANLSDPGLTGTTPAPDLPAPSAAPTATATESLPSSDEPATPDSMALAVGSASEPISSVPQAEVSSAPSSGSTAPSATSADMGSSSAAASDPGPDVEALFARLNLRRPGDLSQPFTDSSNRNTPTLDLPAPTTAQPSAVELTVIPPPAETTAAPLPNTNANSLPPVPDNGHSAPQPNSDVLQVPGPNVPIGSPGGMTNVTVPANLAQAVGAPPSPPSRAAALGLYYRVLVEAPDSATQNQVRSLVSDAFRVRVQGRTMMQTGAYEDESTANAMAEMLSAQGLEVRVEDIRQNR